MVFDGMVNEQLPFVNQILNVVISPLLVALKALL